MTEHGDTDDVINRFLTEDDADRLLAGPGDAGDPLADLLGSLRSSPTEDELDGSDVLVARVVREIRAGDRTPAAVPLGAAGHRPRRRITTRVAALAAASLLSGTAAAATTGNLPAPIQRGVASTFSRIGLDLPSPDDEPAPTTTSVTGTDPSVIGDPADGPVGPTRPPDGAAAEAPDAPTTAGPGSPPTVTSPTGTTPGGTSPAAGTPTAPAPGQDGDSPSDTRPGATAPGATAPGKVENPAGTAPGQGDGSPSDTAPGQGEDSPSDTAPSDVGASGTAPGRTPPTPPSSGRGRP